MELKFISLNIWWGGNLFPQIIDFLKAEDADIVALQEVNNGHEPELEDKQRSMEVLRDTLGYQYDDFAEALIQTGPDGKIPSGNAVLSKLPISSSESTFLFDSTQDEYRDIPEHWPYFPRILQVVTINAPDSVLIIGNMHGVWDLDGDNPSTARQTMVERTLAALAGKPNVMLAGDTNANSGNQVLRDLEQQFTSVFGTELGTTFNMRHKTNPGYATAAVDHMYVSPNTKILSKNCPDVDVSDHLPLVVSVQIT